jgi:hypothetical protein
MARRNDQPGEAAQELERSVETMRIAALARLAQREAIRPSGVSWICS